MTVPRCVPENTNANYGDRNDPVHPDHGWPICAGKTKRLNKYGDPVCLQKPISTSPNKRCKRHNGRCKSGPDAPNFRHGRYARYTNELPTHILSSYQEHLSDPDLLSFRPETAMLMARMSQLVKRLHTGESGSLWKMLNKSWEDEIEATAKQIKQAAAEGDAALLSLALNSHFAAMKAHREILSAGWKDELVWLDLIKTIQAVSDEKNNEIGRLTKERQIVTLDQLRVFVSALLVAAESTIPDPEIRSVFGRRVREIVEIGPAVELKKGEA